MYLYTVSATPLVTDRASTGQMGVNRPHCFSVGTLGVKEYCLTLLFHAKKNKCSVVNLVKCSIHALSFGNWGYVPEPKWGRIFHPDPLKERHFATCRGARHRHNGKWEGQKQFEPHFQTPSTVNAFSVFVFVENAVYFCPKMKTKCKSMMLTFLSKTWNTYLPFWKWNSVGI